MLRSILRRARNWYDQNLGPIPEYLQNSHGILHIGANHGGEQRLYDRADLDVIWVEAIPQVFQKLTANIAMYPRQRPLNYLLSDRDGETMTFNVADNGGASSSIFEFADHKKLWPTVGFAEKIELVSYTLPTMIAREAIDLAQYDALLLDTQGAELLILQGGASCLSAFRYIMAEAADFPSYEGGAMLDEIVAFLGEHGFSVHSMEKFGSLEGVGNYFNVLFHRQPA